MNDPKNGIVKGIKLMALSLPLMLVGPIILSIGFRALNDGVYIWLILGIILIIAAIIVAFLGVKNILNGLFQK
jgi:hypothetical protein